MTASRRKSSKKKTSRTVLNGFVLLALLGTSGYLTVEMQKRKEKGHAPDLGIAAQPGSRQKAPTAGYRYERLAKPARTVVRDGDGAVVATFTDGARTAVLTGPTRTFAEPRTTDAKVVTDSWVRLLPQAWTKDGEKGAWFKDWFKKNLGSKQPDVFAMAMDYGDKTPEQKNPQGLKYIGDAEFGPINPEGTVAGDLRLEESDFYDYLGVSWQFRDGMLKYSEQMRYRAVDCSGFIRLVYGYRAGFPLNGDDKSLGGGLPRTANGMARTGPGVPVIPLTDDARPASIDVLHPGDLVFFEIDARTGARLDHTGIYLGLDTDGHPRFISSREEANGPTLGDLGGDSRLDGKGFYASGLRSAKRL